jgi:hypothetical protein
MALGAVIIANLAVAGLAFSMTGGRALGGDGSLYQYQSLVDQLAVDGVAIVRTDGVFRIDSAPDPSIVRVAQVFPELMVVSLMNSDMTLTLAGDPLPIAQSEVVDALHANGETQFVIYDDSAVRLVIQRSTSR